VDLRSLARLVLHVSIVNAVAYYFRATLELRERQLFLLARENLSKNVYAKELEAARAQAEEGNEIKLRFLANMSHEFRTPMNGVLQTLELLGRSAGEHASALIAQARSSGQALVRTLESILQFTSWTEKDLAAHPAPTSLSESVREVMERHAAEATRRGLRMVLRLDLAGSEDVVMVDKQMLEEAFSRLLDNAVRFTASGGVRVNVELAAHAAQAYPAAEVRISIADTGIGIPAHLHETVFTPFYQVDSASTRAVGGTGLGLAIARRLTAAMHGTLSLESSVGAGTTVHLRLPTEIRKQRAPVVRSGRIDGPPRAQTERLAGTILLAEDNDFNAALIVELLSLMGLAVTRAAEGAEAHRLACERRFDLVLMDCQMPGVDGYEATRRIRASESACEGAARLPIVALTANALSGDRQKCLDAGMDDYLAKPYSADQLHAKLGRWLPEVIATGNNGSTAENANAGATSPANSLPG
jgi:signal transduction histidine kinase/CheY-like chemotaxis protein